MKYRFLLLDADGTLLDFKKAEACGLEATFLRHRLPFHKEILSDYSRINQACWEEFEQGKIDKTTLLSERFRRLFEKYGIEADIEEVRKTYQYELSLGSYLLDHAYEVCKELAASYQLYIVTNGVASTQYRRLKDCGLAQLVDGIFISEEIGFQKPQKEFFTSVFEKIDGFEPDKALMIGDSLSADMEGGIRAGIDTCWYHPGEKPDPLPLPVTYTISDIRKLKEILSETD